MADLDFYESMSQIASARFLEPNNTKVAVLPPLDVPSGWVPLDQLVPMGARPSVEGVLDYDWVVIGAGFTGMSAARHIALLQPSAKIGLIESKPIGWGTSGRNSGFIIDLPHKFDLELDDVEHQFAVLRLNTQAIEELTAIVEGRNIDCEWSRVGKIQGAASEDGLEKIDGFRKILDSIGQPYSTLGSREMLDVTGSEFYTGGLHTPGSVLMNPVKLVRGLAAALPDNVFVHDGCTVVSFDKTIQGHEMKVSHDGGVSQVRSKNILMCANVYAPEFGFLKNRVVPIMTFASMTRRLTDREIAKFPGQLDWGLTPANSGGTTLRMTQDRRLLLRNQYEYVGAYQATHGLLDKVRVKHRSAFLARYPYFSDVPFVSTWGGVCALSSNRTSYFGKLDDNIWGSLCHNGVGVARGTISGRLMAELAIGKSSSLLSDMQLVSGMPAVNPPNPFLSVGVKTRLKLEAFKSKSET